MQQQLQQINGRQTADAQRVRAVVETLANLRNPAETVAEVAHDARNMVTALGLYCDLLEEPGVLAAPFAHYGSELRLVASASRRLVEKLVALEINRDGTSRDGVRTSSPQPYLQSQLQATLPTRASLPAASSATSATSSTASPVPVSPVSPLSTSPVSASSAPFSPVSSPLPTNSAISRPSAAKAREWELAPAVPLKNLAADLMANRNLLSALAGPSIILTTAVDGGAQPVRLTGEDLTRVLINLVKNACEAMPDGGRIRIALGEQIAQSGHTVLLTIEDNGPGIPEESLETIFISGYSTPAAGRAAKGQVKSSWPSTHRGLGLAITRSIIEASGGRIWASNSKPKGARFTIELPVTPA